MCHKEIKSNRSLKVHLNKSLSLYFLYMTFVKSKFMNLNDV